MANVIEGGAKISVCKGVFYNPKMHALRDLSILFLKAVNAKGRLLDSTAATGVRGIRYAMELNFDEIVMLDINTASAKNANSNIKKNGLGVKCLNESIQVYCSDDTRGFDAIDLDPFGTPVPYVNDLLKVSKDGTVFMVTATDTAVLCGAHANACLKLYGSKPMHNELCKESGIRILLNFVIRSAAQFNFGTEILLSVSDMHYMRIFVRLNAGAKNAVDSIKQCGFASFCKKCHSFAYSFGSVPALGTECNVCGSAVEGFGAVYLGSLYDKGVVDRMFKLQKDNSAYYATPVEAILHRISDEPEAPFFYSIPKITKSMARAAVSPDKVISALKAGGFYASRTQFDRDGVKTTASAGKVFEAVKALGTAQT